MVVYALSREGQLNTITSVIGDWKDEIVAKYAKDPRTKEIMEGNITNDEIKIMEKLILYRGRILLAANSKVKRKIMKEYHDNPLSGHTGFYKTYKKLRERYSWKGLKKDIMKYVQECITCQKNKSEQNYSASLLQQLPITNKKWESISMDFIIGLPKVQERDSILVVVDRITKYAHFFPISIHYKAPQIAELFFKEVFRLHGSPRNIISDRDRKFLSLF